MGNKNIEAKTQLWSKSKWIKKRKIKSIQQIGEGSYGLVFSFHDEKDKIDKALKVIEYAKVKAIMAAERLDITVENWFKEAKIEIDHLIALEECKFILRLDDHYFDEENKCIFLITELAESSLSHYIKSRKKISSSELNFIIQCVLNALLYAHERGIVHRDVKPENVLVSSSGTFLLCDWGIARKMKRSGTQTQNTTAKGTPLYTPPEIYKFVEGDTSQVNLFKSDAYSAGLMFLVCCGCSQEEIEFIDRYNEEEHDARLSKILNKIVTENFPDSKELISNLTQFDPKKRFTVEQAMRFCEEKNMFPKPKINSSIENSEDFHRNYKDNFTYDGPTVPLKARKDWQKNKVLIF